MINAFLRLPLKIRYFCGLGFVFGSAFVLALASQAPATNYKALWTAVTVLAFLHWAGTAYYFWWERRWYRYVIFAFSTIATCSYMELTMRVWFPV